MADPTDNDGVKKIRKMFGLDGGEFLDTGMTMEEWMVTSAVERFRNSFGQQSGPEQRRRKEFVVLIVLEGTKAQDVDRFGSIVIESSIGHVMEGDWQAVTHDIEWCEFKGVLVPEKGHVREKEYDKSLLEQGRAREVKLAELWAPFRKILQEAYETRPDRELH